MPNPIIILSHHHRSSPYKFILDNLSLLKRQGYTKLLFELDSETSFESFKQECTNLLSVIPKETLAYTSLKALFNMLLALEKNGIFYAFIDPETRAESVRLDKNINSTKSIVDRARCIKERERATELRDIAMAKVIQYESKINGGGVIFIGGFRHKELLPQLKLIDPLTFYCPVIFANSEEENRMITPELKDGDFDHWLSLYKKEFRDQFYGVNVNFFDMSEKPTFEAIQVDCGFTVPELCTETPLIGEYFNKTAQRTFTYTFDEGYVLTASSVVNDAEDETTTKKMLSKTFPGLRFFSIRSLEKTTLYVPKLNLPENHSILEEAFVSHGVMRK